MGVLGLISQLFGWMYFLCWSLSFYPQPLLNVQRRSTSGTTVDFPMINCLGFLAYGVANLALYYSPLIQAQYAARHPGLTPTVQFNDIAFALHALLLSLISTSQYFLPRAWGLSPSARSRPSRFIVGLFLACIFGVLAVIYVVLCSPDRNGTEHAANAWMWLDVVYAVSYVKLVVTLIKFTPQVLANYWNQSTEGWSIRQILLDVVGGVLSIAQQGVDSYLQRDWSGITGNPVKFALGNVSMAFDAVFIAQHYVIYPKIGEKAGPSETDALLGREDVEAQ